MGHRHAPSESGETRVSPHTHTQGDECLLVLKCLFFDLRAQPSRRQRTATAELAWTRR
jgi:hypothetical protein